MLVVSRGQDESAWIGEKIRVTVLQTGNQVKLGIEAPKDFVVLREELAGIAGEGICAGSGKHHAPEKARLSEIIDHLNDLFGAEVSDEDKLQFANGIADRIRRDDAVMAQVENDSPDQVIHGLFPKRVTDTVLDAMTDHEKLSMQVLDDNERQKDFALLILRLLTGDASHPRLSSTRSPQ